MAAYFQYEDDMHSTLWYIIYHHNHKPTSPPPQGVFPPGRPLDGRTRPCSPSPADADLHLCPPPTYAMDYHCDLSCYYS
ncbi:unnamed protein product [Cylicocyclus nassatus]|uniref:Uncharacterized protein n=1 Tax=Cylicocyclus nassatus TaxID=53992 RepID=A0AA36MD48_CYLNA|nr:unnamed protein product [Cylicocyclus nassatus]